MKIFLCALIVAVVANTQSMAVVIGPGEIYQQPADVEHILHEGLFLHGGQIIERESGATTSVLWGQAEISNGIVNSSLRLDPGPLGPIDISGSVFNGPLEIARSLLSTDIAGSVFNNSVNISGSAAGFVSSGIKWDRNVKISDSIFQENTEFHFSSAEITNTVFNDSVSFDMSNTKISNSVFHGNLEINRSNAEIASGVFHGELNMDGVGAISRITGGESYLRIFGGDFHKKVTVTRYRGDVLIAGGNFQEGISLSPLGGGRVDDDIASLSFMGDDWTLDGQAVSIENNIADLTGKSGMLEGTLLDGNSFSVFLEAGRQPYNVTVQVPEPSAALLMSMAMALALCARRRLARN